MMEVMDVQEVLKSLADRLQSAANVKSVYGDPVTMGDRVVIPVARVGFGFGAGGQNLLGGGGGGGAGAHPVGIVEISPAGSVFKAFPNYRRIGAAFAAGVVFGMLMSRKRR
jgi:uncharacterized spore protein YtfJ